MPFVLLEAPGPAAPRVRGRRWRTRRAPCESCGRDRQPQPRRGDARRQPRSARAPRTRPTTATVTLAELERRISECRRVARARARGSSRPTTRATSSSTSTASRASPMRLVLNPGSWTHYAWAIHDALELAGAARGRGPPLRRRRRASSGADTRCSASLCIGRVAGQGPEGYRDALGSSGTSSSPAMSDGVEHGRPGSTAWPESRASTRCSSPTLRQRPLSHRLHRQQRPRRSSARRRGSFVTDFRYVEQAAEEVRRVLRAPPGAPQDLLDGGAGCAARRSGRGSGFEDRPRVGATTRAARASLLDERVELVGRRAAWSRSCARSRSPGEVERDPARRPRSPTRRSSALLAERARRTHRARGRAGARHAHA